MRLVPRYPVFIPSKGRAKNFLTAKVFDRDGVPFTVVVEPSQVDDYAAVVGRERVLVLPENSKGLVYSRNWITAYSRKKGHERHWQIDDDINKFYRVNGSSRIPCDSAAALRISEDFADRYENVGLLSLNSVFFLGFQMQRSCLPPFYLNHRCYTIILFQNSMPYDWRPPNNEDADMTLQALSGGWCTILLNAFAMSTASTMTLRGGQTEAFIAGARLKMVRALARRWPGVVKVGRRFQHPQHFIKGDWVHFDNKLKLRPGVDLAKLPKVDEMGLKLKAVKKVKSPRMRKLLEESNA